MIAKKYIIYWVLFNILCCYNIIADDLFEEIELSILSKKCKDEIVHKIIDNKIPHIDGYCACFYGYYADQLKSIIDGIGPIKIAILKDVKNAPINFLPLKDDTNHQQHKQLIENNQHIPQITDMYGKRTVEDSNYDTAFLKFEPSPDYNFDAYNFDAYDFDNTYKHKDLDDFVAANRLGSRIAGFSEDPYQDPAYFNLITYIKSNPNRINDNTPLLTTHNQIQEFIKNMLKQSINTTDEFKEKFVSLNQIVAEKLEDMFEKKDNNIISEINDHRKMAFENYQIAVNIVSNPEYKIDYEKGLPIKLGLYLYTDTAKNEKFIQTTTQNLLYQPKVLEDIQQTQKLFEENKELIDAVKNINDGNTDLALTKYKTCFEEKKKHYVLTRIVIHWPKYFI